MGSVLWGRWEAWLSQRQASIREGKCHAYDHCHSPFFLNRQRQEPARLLNLAKVSPLHSLGSVACSVFIKAILLVSKWVKIKQTGNLKISKPEPFYFVKTGFDCKWDKTDFVLGYIFLEGIFSLPLVSPLTLQRLGYNDRLYLRTNSSSKNVFHCAIEIILPMMLIANMNAQIQIIW